MIDFLINFVWDCKTLVVPIVLLLPVTLILALAGWDIDGIRVVVWGWMLGTMLGNALYVVWRERRRL